MPNKRYGKTTAVRKSEAELADLIIRPIVTEKATYMMEDNKYVFECVKQATKPQIRAAIESLFEVKVVKVNTMNQPRKKRRVGQNVGYKPQYKKAIVTLAEGDSLQSTFFPDL
ncbi:LSU ribosomal protein L23 RplW [Cyanobacterium sp. HL-69]|jgi:large subunit ribosomal protein L23|uniref:Large ribosomal subunit protein uL23 n=2 Tax=Cyanobacterium stanieri TaxID=102235 RepID=K9YMP0_CYASC|nr:MULTISPECIES: 50S ribosomal protein L23 [Cyanobacterium]AFZ48144.1 LSU ribosomal protein L23P [Cyanobacterium stanieri PCC 7202]AUC59849.1 LSU ribosomal protein L23 RplW [Cyanobacterium sp. HL-69]MBE9221955.1 50S ribosomal protein L23 [Cyanobacterium stanieri LEGE 03274]OEJ79187.1 50S ribosomal protein L23 [Cyanobacterium sp. IPPAS B-1200]